LLTALSTDDFKPDKIEAYGLKMFYEENNIMPVLEPFK
jgi:hypothetical protein